MRKLVKWGAIVWLAGEWWTRGGREALMGPRSSSASGDIDSFERWVHLDQRSLALGWNAEGVPGREITDPHGNVIGVVVECKQESSGARVRVRFQRAQLGWPINVALAQADDYTRRTLTGSRVA